MKRMVTAAIVCGALWLGATVAEAQTTKKGASGLAGLVTSKGATIVDTVGVDDTVVVLTAPAAGGGFFILTQACATSPGDVQISGSSVGPIVLSTNDECTQFNPGIALAAGETLSCKEVGDNGDQQCTVMGVLVKK